MTAILTLLTLVAVAAPAIAQDRSQPHDLYTNSASLSRSTSNGRRRSRMLRTGRRSAGTRSFAGSKSARFAL